MWNFMMKHPILGTFLVDNIVTGIIMVLLVNSKTNGEIEYEHGVWYLMKRAKKVVDKVAAEVKKAEADD